MRRSERCQQLIDLLTERGEIDVLDLVKVLDVSEATIRRDLTLLQNKGELIRTPGGARLQTERSLVIRTFQEKWKQMRAVKEHIGRKAAQLVAPGMVVALDSGTTIWRIAAALKAKAPLTILTNALAVIEELGAIPGIQLYCSGGKLNPRNLDFVGPGSMLTASGLRADVAFLGADSLVPGKGIYTMDEASALSSAALAQCADRRLVVVDHTKIHARGCYRVISTKDINGVVTDSDLPENVLRELKAEPYELILAT